MAPYIGTATSRVDGIAKVTGAAKYAAEFNVPDLAHASLVCSTIAKGRITRIDTGAATRVKGVLTVLTHENRPPVADNDEGYKDEVAPDGSPYRPLYDGKIRWSTSNSRTSRTSLLRAMRPSPSRLPPPRWKPRSPRQSAAAPRTRRWPQLR